jgi:hypothetical protein
MCTSVTDAGAADIFVELIVLNADDQCSELEKDAQIMILQIMSSPEQVKKDLVGATKYLN